MDSRDASQGRYGRLTPRLAWLLAAPHTWPASLMPVLVAIATASVATGTLSVMMSLSLLIACVLMQSSVNTFNDYFDYVKGTDSKDDNVEESDAVLVYNNINPRSALGLAIGFLVVAFVFGAYAIYVAGWVPLVLALIGAAAVVLYSFGKTPISYLPIGELVSGVVMGGLIFCACYYACALTFSPAVLLWAVPLVIDVALIMFTNNLCDIEKDTAVSRRTLAVRLGRPRARRLYFALLAAWIVLIVVIVAIWFTPGILIVVVMLVASYPFLRPLFANPLDPKSRIAAMSQICVVSVVLGAFYACAVFASSSALVVF